MKNKALGFPRLLSAISMLLAGGVQLSYSGWRSVAWLVLTGFVLLSVLGSWGGLLLVQATRRPAA